MDRLHSHSSAAASLGATPNSPRAPTAFRSTFAAVEAGRANLSLPAWARNTECKLLLSLIEVERPERTRVLTRTLGGTAADFGFAGGYASQLRIIFERTYETLMDWASAAPTRQTFEQRRQAVHAYGEQFGADALIARLLGESKQ